MQAGLVVGAGIAHVKSRFYLKSEACQVRREFWSQPWLDLTRSTHYISWETPDTPTPRCFPTAATCQRSPALELVTTLP